MQTFENSQSPSEFAQRVRQKSEELMADKKGVTPEEAEFYIVRLAGGCPIAAGLRTTARALVGDGVIGPTHRLATPQEIKDLKATEADSAKQYQERESKRNAAKFQIIMPPQPAVEAPAAKTQQAKA